MATVFYVRSVGGWVILFSREIVIKGKPIKNKCSVIVTGRWLWQNRKVIKELHIMAIILSDGIGISAFRAYRYKRPEYLATSFYLGLDASILGYLLLYWNQVISRVI